MQSYPQADARKLCEGKPRSGRKQDWFSRTLAILADFLSMYPVDISQAALKSCSFECALQPLHRLFRAWRCHPAHGQCNCSLRGIVDSKTKFHAENLCRRASVFVTLAHIRKEHASCPQKRDLGPALGWIAGQNCLQLSTAQRLRT